MANALKEFVDYGGIPDLRIYKEESLVVKVAGRPIHVRAFTIRNFKRYIGLMGAITLGFEEIFAGLEWPAKPDNVEAMRKKFVMLWNNKRVFRRVMKMMRLTVLREPGNRWWRWHWRFFKRNVTMQELIDLFFYIYLWNMEAVKKNVAFLLKRMGFVRTKGTLFSGWSENLAGLSGVHVKPRFNVPPLDFSKGRGSQSKTSSTSPTASQPSSPAGRARGNTSTRPHTPPSVMGK